MTSGSPARSVARCEPAQAAEINWNGKPGSTFVQWTRPVGLSARGTCLSWR